MESRNRQNGHDTPQADDIRQTAYAMLDGAQERLRAGVDKAAEAMPDAMAGAQVAARDTQRRLEEMSEQSLLAGASFSLGLAIGLFVSGANRLIVALTLVPAAAMLTTLMGREKEATANEASGTSGSARRRRPRATAG
jgi:hypothetical protein